MDRTGSACIKQFAATKLLLISAILMIGVLHRPVYCSHLQNQIKPMEISSLSDEDLLHAFGSSNMETSHDAVMEIKKRGERMLPMLMKYKGNRNYFYGYGLGHHNSAFLIPNPTGNARADEGRVITLEVAALYLICSIYYDSLEFAQAAYLTDGSVIKQHRFNTRPRVAAAWRAVEPWYQRVRADGLEAVRSKKDSPLPTSGVRFWATSE